MLVSKKLTTPTILLFSFSCLFPFLADFHIPLLHGGFVRCIENIQALLLLLIAIFSYCYIRPDQCPEGKKQFWFWAVFWWIMLFGRSISWGRDYFPEVPRGDFRILSIIFIAPVILMLFSAQLRQEIVNKFKTVKFPTWSFVLALATFIIADSIEHSRFLLPIFLHDIHYKDFMEEMYEFPIIFGLFEVTYLLMKQDKQDLKQNQKALETVNQTADQSVLDEVSSHTSIHKYK